MGKKSKSLLRKEKAEAPQQQYVKQDNNGAILTKCTGEKEGRASVSFWQQIRTCKNSARGHAEPFLGKMPEDRILSPRS